MERETCFLLRKIVHLFLYVPNKGFTTCVYYKRFPEPESSLGGLLNLIKPWKI
jgi:hypothetical protein